MVPHLVDGQDPAADHFRLGGDEGGHHQARAVAEAERWIHVQRLQGGGNSRGAQLRLPSGTSPLEPRAGSYGGPAPSRERTARVAGRSWPGSHAAPATPWRLSLASPPAPAPLLKVKSKTGRCLGRRQGGGQGQDERPAGLRTPCRRGHKRRSPGRRQEQRLWGPPHPHPLPS